tara:strand:+ start:306 stop:608 length:303 start_codon:yes stop_codon:yes gene_type:complete
MYFDKRDTKHLVRLINFDIRYVIEDYLKRNKQEKSEHKLNYMIPIIESLIKNNHELYYTDFDIFSIPTAVRKRLFDGYVEEYRENANVMKNTKQMGKWFR